MQFSRYITYKKNSSTLGVWPLLLKVVLAAASFYYIISKVLEEQVVFNSLLSLFNSLEFFILIFVTTVLMLINWWLESKKWQLIANSYQPINLIQALKAILTGVSLDAILPFGSGAVGSKVLSLDGQGRQKLIAPIVVAQGIQSFWTVFFGLIGLYKLALMTDIIAIYGSAKTIFIIAFLFTTLVVAISRFWPDFTNSLIRSVKRLSQHTWLKIFIISFFRYMVFFVQLLILSKYLAPEIPVWVLIGCITWMFFAKTIVPKPGHLGAVGIRGAAVVFYLNLAGFAFSEVVIATLVLWIINLAIPSLVGLFFMKDLNLRIDSE